MYNYSDITLEKLEEDLKSTIEECKVLVSNIKSSRNNNLENFNELESAIYDLSGRIAFMGNVHPDEKIRDFGNEADSRIQNLALEIYKDQDLYEKFKEIQESIVIGQSWDNDIRIILFVVLNKISRKAKWRYN